MSINKLDELTYGEFNKILGLRFKVCLGDPEAISEIDQIAKKIGLSNTEELYKSLDEFIDKLSALDDSEENRIFKILHKYQYYAFAVLDEIINDFPEVAYQWAKNRVMENDLLFKDIIKTVDYDYIYEIVKGKSIKSLPKKPYKEASMDEWFEYYTERKKLGIPITLDEIARIKIYNSNYIRQLHRLYNLSHDKKE